MGHEYAGVVEEVGSAVTSVRPGQFVVGSFFASDNTCEIDIVTDRGDAGVAAVKDLTGGLGAQSVIEAVGTQEAMMQAIHATRPGGHVGYVGVAHDVALPGMDLFFSHVHLHGGPAPVRRFLPDLIDRIWTRQIEPGKVFDLELPLDKTAAGYQAMDRREAIKVLLHP